jgi:hypothetical protein
VFTRDLTSSMQFNSVKSSVTTAYFILTAAVHPPLL